jgi:peptidoglycan/LPS O-acetylase OafA/YrhL
MTTETTTQSTSIPPQIKPQRRYDIDWLRVLAVLLLFPFHTARIFDTFDPWYVKNGTLSEALTYFIAFVHPFHMPLLFLLAGASTWFALSYRSAGQYAKERVIRLLIPFIFGVLVIVPPQSYFALLGHSDYSKSYFEWYPNFLSINSNDMDGYFLGGFTPAHLWFIAFLFIFSLLALPIFLYLRRRDSGKRLTGWLAAFFSLPGAILLLAIPLWVAYEVIDFYPSPLYFISYFILGYLLVADTRFEKAIDRHKAIALVIGPILYLFVAYFQVAGWPEGMLSRAGSVINAYTVGFAPWFFVIAILGYGRRFLTSSNKFLKYTGPASYPYYILHQTIIVIIGFYVVQWQVGLGVKYLVILAAAITMTALLHELLVRRFNLFRFFFGMKLMKKQESPAPTVEPGR